jgi:protein-S-isoprenylcysteine O-methyltransferase Ste14
MDCGIWFYALLYDRARCVRWRHPVVHNALAIPAGVFRIEAIRAAGAALIAIGLAGLIDSFARFALQGFGTPAPIAPPKRLVATGLYRYVRNPMYVTALATVLGLALLFGDVRVLAYGAPFWLATHIFAAAYEERQLERTFGAEYRRYRANVPRWIPRLTRWRGA